MLYRVEIHSDDALLIKAIAKMFDHIGEVYTQIIVNESGETYEGNTMMEKQG